MINSSLGHVLVLALATMSAPDDHLPDTAPLDWDGDLASRMIDGIDRFLLNQLDRSMALRERHWSRDPSSAEAYGRSLEWNRRRLASLLGVRDARLPFQDLALDAPALERPEVAVGEIYNVYAVRWPVARNITGEGLLLEPAGDRQPSAWVVAIPDADQTPESICGLVDGVPEAAQFGRRLAESGCRVLVPCLIDRTMDKRGNRVTLTSREYVYRGSFNLGRHVIGYEVQKVLAAVDWLKRSAAPGKVGVIGYGEGGMLALYSGAIDPRIDAVCVGGYFDSRQDIWQEPISRNVFGLLERFGDAELAAMIAPRPLVIAAGRFPEMTIAAGDRAAPARIVTPPLDQVRAEVARAEKLAGSQSQISLVAPPDARGTAMNTAAVRTFLTALGVDMNTRAARESLELWRQPNAAERHARQVEQLVDHNAWLLAESPYVRQEFMKDLDTSSLEAYVESARRYREIFRDEVIGRFDLPLLPANPRSRRWAGTEDWTAYEVVLDVFPDVFAYGILILPTGIQPGERRPVVVCQHGLEGRPEHVIRDDHRAYHDYAAKLAERGFITFAPQNIYIFGDRFRTLQRKANPLQKTLFSIMVPQHQQIVDWLAGLPQVDPERIAFYGLSYGGKSAMRIPPLVERYCLSICSADFNEWVWKNVSTRAPHSYVWTGEYEIFEWDLGSTFNYAEMAALIAPRPFMVERGHFDGVAPDETVGYEFAKVRHLYNARLGIGDRCEIEWFFGPYKGVHTINGQGTFEFLERHLGAPRSD